jgi:hypothetical protein
MVGYRASDGFDAAVEEAAAVTRACLRQHAPDVDEQPFLGFRFSFHDPTQTALQVSNGGLIPVGLQ